MATVGVKGLSDEDVDFHMDYHSGAGKANRGELSEPNL